MKLRLSLAIGALLLIRVATLGAEGGAPGPEPLSELEQQNWLGFFARTAAVCPLDSWREVNRAARQTHRRQATREQVDEAVALVERDLPTLCVVWDGARTALKDATELPLLLARGVERCLIVRVTNAGAARAFRARLGDGPKSNAATIPTGESFPLLVQVTASAGATTALELALQIEPPLGAAGAPTPVATAASAGPVPVPVRVVEPARLVGVLRDADTGAPTPGRLWIRGADGVHRHAFAPHAANATLSEKRLYELLEGEPFEPAYYRLPFSYSGPSGEFALDLPPGPTRVRFERGYEHPVVEKTVAARSGVAAQLALESGRFVDLQAQGWVSSETHVHWSVNDFHADESYPLLELVQRAEDVRVIHNLTLRGSLPGHPDFVAPQVYPPGPVWQDPQGYLCRQGQEWRNDGGLGHANLLNIGALVQPVACGPDLMYLLEDQYDWPLPAQVYDQARAQTGGSLLGGRRGLAIPAHGFVPWTAADLATGRIDALDQVLAADYYDVLDCGFALPMTVGGDHPARVVGHARTYVRVAEPDGWSYADWVDGLLAGATFVSSGPLLFLRASSVAETVEVGGTLELPSTAGLHLEAEVLRRPEPDLPPLRVQIVSNREVLAETVVTGTHGQANVNLWVGESRWVVARCAPVGAGGFEPLEHEHAAHTSAIRVLADGDARGVTDPQRVLQLRNVCLQLAQAVGAGELLVLEHPWQRDAAEQYLRDAAAIYDALLDPDAGR